MTCLPGVPMALSTRRLQFVIGQVWEPRRPERTLSEDYWRIEAITDHPQSPVIARHECGAIRAFGLDGHCDGDEGICDLDLVTLVRDVEDARKAVA